MTGSFDDRGPSLRDQGAVRKVAMVLSAVFLVVLAIAPRAIAAEPEAVLNSTTSDDVMWFEGQIDDAEAGDVHIVVRAPRKKGNGNVLWARCDFAFKGSGTYRCGVDVSPGSAASEREGAWKVHLKVDEARLKTLCFKMK